MSQIADAFDQWMRNFVADGVPGSGVNPPSKAEGRSIGSLIESYVAQAIANGVSAGGAAKIMLDCGDETTPLAPGEVKRFRLPYGLSLTEVRASLTSPSLDGDSPSAHAVQVDIQLVGDSPPVSILGDPLQIDGGDTTSVGSIAPPTIITSELDDNAELVIVVLDEGSGAAGLKVHMIGSWAAFGVGAIPYFVAAGAWTAKSSGQVNVPYPAGIAENDILVIQVGYGDGDESGSPSNSIVRPSGWEILVNPLDHSNSRSAIFWKRATGLESGTQAVTGLRAAAFGAGIMSAWRGCVENGDFFESLDTSHGHGHSMVSPTVTTLGPNRRAVLFYFENILGLSDPDTGWTEVFDAGSLTYYACSIQGLPLPATTTAETRIRGAEEHDWTCVALALVPGTS